VTPSAVKSLSFSLLIARMEQPAAPAPLLELTAGLARGDDLAWTQFHREFGPAVFRQLLAATHGDHALASDALQQTYLRIAKHARPCESEPMFRGWLRVVARTALSDCRRRQRSFWTLLHRRQADPSDLDTTTADEERLQAALDTALARLDAADRALLEAKYLSGHEVRRIAEDLAITPKAVESRLTRARAELRRELLALLPRHEP
jgi:RNA polymerase sigma factor (sigma-70 family)